VHTHITALQGEHPSALGLIAQTMAARIRPPEAMPFSRWLTENIVLVDGPSAGELWTAAGAPYLLEIADCLSDDDPCNLVTVRKSQLPLVHGERLPSCAPSHRRYQSGRTRSPASPAAARARETATRPRRPV
jgi:hypothetical protein